MPKKIDDIFNLNSRVFSRLERRAGVPALLRDLVHQGSVEVTITVDAATALALADDIEFAVQERPLGKPRE
jgi:hypothetical protein